jgi:Leucine-rich repeat (LRR) protein
MRIKLRKNISTLNIEQIPLDIQSLEIIGESLEKLPSFKKFIKLNNIYINGPQVTSYKEFPLCLKVLKIRDGQLSNDCLNDISLLANIETLSLIGTKIETLPISFFTRLEKITTIDLKNNLLTEIPSSIKNLKQLSRINIDQNNFTKFPNDLYSMKQINHISADHNNFDENEKSIIHRELGLWF